MKYILSFTTQVSNFSGKTEIKEFANLKDARNYLKSFKKYVKSEVYDFSPDWFRYEDKKDGLCEVRIDKV